MPFSPLVSKIRVHDPNKKGASSANRNYATYIATREGVSLENVKGIDDILQIELMNEKNLNEQVIHNEAGNKEYVEYMARRPKSHGLFGNINTDDLKAVSSDIAALTKQGKIIYRGIISLSEKDGEELGFRNKEAWNNYLQKVMPEIAQKLGVSYDHTWVAAFHAEEKHPHVHYMLWDNKDKIKSPYIPTATQQAIRIYLEEEMFDDSYEHAIRMVHSEELEEQKRIRSKERKQILLEVENKIQEMGYVPGINYERLPNRPSNEYLGSISEEMRLFIGNLSGKGRFAYKYLPPEEKQQLNKIVDMLLENGEIKNSVEKYLNGVSEMHRLYGETNKKIETEIERAREDIIKRMANRILNQIKPVVMELDQEEHLENTKEEVLQQGEQKFDVTEDEYYMEMGYIENMMQEEEMMLADIETDLLVQNIGRGEPGSPENQMIRSESDSPEEQMTRSEPDSSENQMTRSEPGSPEDQIYKMEWSKTFKEAMRYIYAEKPEIEKASKLLDGEANREKNVLAIHELAKLAERELIHVSSEEKVGYYNKSLEGFQYVYAHPGCKKSREEWTKSYAAYRIGKLYDFGKGEIEADYEKAAKWYQQAGNNKYAEYSLAKLYLSEKIYVSENLDLSENQQVAYKLLIDAASQTKANPFAAYELGMMYQNGNYVGINEKEAYEWYEKALNGFLNMSDNSTDDSLFYRLGDMYLTGKGTEIDAEKGEKYLEIAAKLENDNAKMRLAEIYLDKEDEILRQTAVKLLAEVSEKGNSLVQYKLGCIYADPQDDNIYNMDKAIEYLEMSAQQENPYAQYRLGVIYSDPELQGRYDINKAIKYFKAIADQGNQFAQCRLGCIYADPQDDNIYNMDKAIEYLEMSAQQENSYAQYRLGVIYSDPELQGRHDINKAIKYFKAVADQGNQFAQCRLGCIYYFGKGVGRNREQGVYWLHKAADQGNEYAKKILDAELEIGTGFSYCLVKSTLSAMETMNRQIGQQNQELSRTQSKQALKEQRMHHKEKEQSIW